MQVNTPVPDGFETSAMRQAREERQRREGRERAAQETRQQLEDEHENYCDIEIDRYIESNRSAFEELKQRKWEEDREQFAFPTESMTNIAAKNKIRKQLTLLTFEEFMETQERGDCLFFEISCALPEFGPTREQAGRRGA